MEVTATKVLTTVECIQTGINFGQWELIFLDKLLNLTIVNMESHDVILFSHNHHIRTPR